MDASRRREASMFEHESELIRRIEEAPRSAARASCKWVPVGLAQVEVEGCELDEASNVHRRQAARAALHLDALMDGEASRDRLPRACWTQ